MSTLTPTPRRGLSPPGFTRLLSRLSSEGWRVEIPASRSRGRAAFVLLARRRDNADRLLTSVIHGHAAGHEIRLDDVWAVVAHMSDVQAEQAVLYVEPGMQVSGLADDTATRLGVTIAELPCGGA